MFIAFISLLLKFTGLKIRIRFSLQFHRWIRNKHIKLTKPAFRRSETVLLNLNEEFLSRPKHEHLFSAAP